MHHQRGVGVDRVAAAGVHLEVEVGAGDEPGRARGLYEPWTAHGAVPTRAYSPAAFGPLLGLSASSVSITGAGPEIPPSFLTRQK